MIQVLLVFRVFRMTTGATGTLGAKRTSSQWSIPGGESTPAGHGVAGGNQVQWNHLGRYRPVGGSEPSKGHSDDEPVGTPRGDESQSVGLR